MIAFHVIYIYNAMVYIKFLIKQTERSLNIVFR
jgi:hypothetical protein